MGTGDKLIIAGVVTVPLASTLFFGYLALSIGMSYGMSHVGWAESLFLCLASAAGRARRRTNYGWYLDAKKGEGRFQVRA